MKKKHFATLVVSISLCMTTHAQILTESFNGITFPPTGWANVQISGAANPGTWQRVSSGTNPTCSPHSGAGMAYYNSYSWSGGNAADLSTPVLDFSSGAFAVSFWMYRDGGEAANYDSVCVYVNTVGASAGGTRIGVINRSRTLAPVEASDGWYNYTFNVPSNYNTATNRIIFKATSDFGNRMYLDDVSVYELVPPANLTSVTTSTMNVCAGGSTKLYANGVDGVVYWYANSCSGTALGTGDSIVVTPAQTTTYFARNFKNNQFSVNCASLTITVKDTFNVVLNKTICAHETILLPGGLVADTTGTYSVSVPTVAGCDSTVTLNLTVLPELLSSFSQTICNGDTLFYNSFTYSASGTYTDTLTAANGCDSVVTINLTVRPLIETVFNQTICFGDTLSFNGQEYSAAGKYTDTLSAANGCDSLVTLQLTISPIIQTGLNQNICFGDTLTWNNRKYFASGTYTDTLTAANGCDSVVTINLTVLPLIETVFNQAICFGDTLSFNGQEYSAVGKYTDTLSAANGCDSLVTLQLTILPVIQTGINQNICFGDTLTWNNQKYFASGTYTDTLTSASGCDSLVVLNLTVKSIITGTVNLSICNGDSVLYNGLYYSAAGSYPDTLTSVGGCDSLVTLQIALFNSTTPSIISSGFTLSVQSYSSYQWIKDGTDIQGATSQTYTATADGMYSVRVTDANGCTTISLPVSVLGTSVNDSEVFSFSVFPNPVADILHVIGLSNNNFTLRIFNAVGEEIASEKQVGDSMSVQHLPTGFYILSLSSGNYTHHRVFVKQ